ncbi:MAG: NYN domain-containing protein [Thauera sp.]|nr:NYN domain-containing protein [Thauera sp.]
MASSPDSISMALFCDFENVALGVRDAKYEKFDIKRVLERLLLKGSIVVKKAYCDWDRYKSFKAAMHEANFELIEIPHVRQSGKNSADIRLVVDALDLCYTKSHVDTFVIISGDSDFSPLVSKLRENAKQVIGVGVKQSTSDLLIANCDEFIFYDDLVRDSQRAAAKREARDNPPASRRQPEEDKARREELESRRSKAIDIAVETFDALLAERGESGKIWSSMLKEAIKRRKPDFNESYFGFRAFGNLLEEAQARGLLELGRDEKSGIFVTRPGPGLAAPRMREEFATAGEPLVVERAAPRTEPTVGVAEAEPGAERASSPAGAGGETSANASEPRRGRGRGRGRAARALEEPAAEGVAVEAHVAATVEEGETAIESAPAALVLPAETVAQATSEGAGHAEDAAVAVEPRAAEAEPESAQPPRASAARRRRGGKAEAAVTPAAAAPAAAGADLVPAPAVAGEAHDAVASAAQEEKPKGKGKGKDKQKQKEKPSEAAKPSSRRSRGGRAAGAKAAAEGAGGTATAAGPSASAAPAQSAARDANTPEAETAAPRPRRVRKPKAESGE